MLRSAVLALLGPATRTSGLLHTLPKCGARIAASASPTSLRRSLSAPRCLSSQPASLAESDSKSRRMKDHLSKLSESEQEEFAKAELAKLSPEDEKRLRVLEMEYDVWSSTGGRMPDSPSNSMWLQLLHTKSRAGRSKLYSFWFKRQMQIRGDLAKKELRQRRHLERQAEKRKMLEEQGRQQGLPEGTIPIMKTISLFIRPQTMLRHYYNNMAWAMQYGQSLVMDLGLESHMKDRERTSLIKQVLDAYGINKIQQEPFHMVLTGLKPDSFINKKLARAIDLETVPITVTSQNYSDLYAQDQLVYLTPDSPNELLTWSPHDVYIIGGLVDLSEEKPVTFAKARRQKIRTARLPLDRYMMWEQGTKALTLDVIQKILCEMKESGDWVKAFRHIPSRKAQIRPQYLKNTSQKSRQSSKK